MKIIPLNDDSGEETNIDYSGLDWPTPMPDLFESEPVQPLLPPSNSPHTDAIFANIQLNLKSMMGGGTAFPPGNPGIESAMFAAQKAAEEELRKQGLLPSGHISQFQQYPVGEEPMLGGEEPYEAGEADFNRGFPPGGILGNQPPPPPPQVPGNWNPAAMHGGGGFRGSNRGFDHRGRGFFRGKRGRDGFDKSRDDKKKDFNRERRPCRFWSSKGYCREGDFCKFLHVRR